MKLPRDISGPELARSLKQLGYQITRQTGSHLRLTTSERGQHHVTIPNHDPIKVGTLSGRVGPVYEYVTIRWAGKDNTHIVRPGGQVEFIGVELRKLTRPDRADERSFYMNTAMNGLSKNGYEFAGMTSDDVVMKRAIAR
jgi:predicted RNA binding protein YcfA (HicA-like mRNA interferase family)